MGESSAEPVVADPPPDWEKRTDDLLCPLCDYNLRGLSEPRCPECGYQFTWAGLQDDLRNQHPWLFEHQKTRRIRALLKTWFISQFPRRFWKAVQPTHTPRLRRSVIYGLVTSTILVAILAWTSGLGAFTNSYSQVYQSRRDSLAYLQTDKGKSVYAPQLARYGSPQAFVDAASPYPPFWSAWEEAARRRSPVERIAAQLSFVMICWPWMTLASLLLFRQTLRQARIRTVHVMRCAIYSCDLAPLVLFPAAVVLSSQLRFYAVTYYDDRRPIVFIPAALATMMAFMGIFSYRLSVAYQRYLHFRHAIATCVASQMIVWLLVLYFLPWTIV